MLCQFAGTISLGSLPPASAIAGVGLIGSAAPPPGTTGGLVSYSPAALTPIMAIPGASLAGNPITAGAAAWLGGSSSIHNTVVVVPGIPAIKKALAESILAGECIDLAELPPAKGRSKTLPSSLEGQVVLLHATDYLQAKRLIPDLATWLQCFVIYIAVVTARYPERQTSLLLYMSTMAKLSQKFKWPSWVIYDHSYRQDAAENHKTDWSKVEAGIHAQCFTGMAISTEGWCKFCHSIDHASQLCPVKPWEPAKRQMASPGGPPLKRANTPVPICKKYNRFGGDCSFGSSCKYLHVCSRCGGPHPVTKCDKPTTATAPWASIQQSAVTDQ